MVAPATGSKWSGSGRALSWLFCGIGEKGEDGERFWADRGRRRVNGKNAPDRVLRVDGEDQGRSSM
jgi:hypothetical protein